MESLQWARRQCRQVLSSEAGLGWYLPADSPASKNGPANSDSAAYKPGGKRRTVIAHHGPYQDEYYSISKGYQGNRIRTTKYTLLSFIPMNLFEQFHRTANLYFLFLVLLNWVPVVEAFQKEITMIPLVVVLGVIAFKDALEDYRRYCFDKMINNNVTKVYCGKQRRYVDKHWKDVCVGDFVRLACNEIIPADMVLLQSSDPDGVCHIETSNLDGETNLKQRQVVKGLAEQGSDVIPEKFDSRIECESPNNDLSRFRGFLENPRWGTRVGLRSENLLLRSCAIRNTEAVIGIVVYAGHETKAMKNNSGPRYKRSKLERRLNIDVLWSVVLLLVMCLAAAVGHGLWLSGLRNPPFIVPDGTSPALAGFYLFWTMIIVLQVLIPISLYVSIEIVKLGQVYFIQNDVDFHEGRLASGVQCRALNITEDLGQVQYVFSDKTGTLTENKMVFCRCSIAGVEYPHEDNARRLELYHHQDWDDDDDDDDDDNSHPTMKAKSRSSLRSLSCRSMDCNRSSISLHTLTDCDPAAEDQVEALDGGGRRQVAFSSRMEKDVIPDPRLIQKLNQLSSPKLSGEIGDTSQEIPYIVDFFLAIALCNTVVVSSPNQQQKTACLIPEVPRKPLRSLEDMKQLFQRFGVPRIGSFSSTGEKMSQTSDSSASFTQRIFFRTKGSRPSLTMPKVDEEDGEESQVRASTPTQTEVVGAAEVEPLQQAELCGDACLVQGELEELMYEAESPDEAALVHAARAYRCILRARTSEQLVVDLPGLGHLSVPVLHVLPFDSLRKRMSVVVRHPLTGQVVVYTKGADSAIMDLTASPTDDCPNAGCQRRIKEQTQRHLDDYAREGLRTLCIATKVLEEEDYAMWLKTYTFAETSIENREELLLESVKELEKDLTLLGATGIVDRLQEEVPETIEALQMAGMKVWVLTGDKQETAVNVACSCKLLRPSDKLLTANCDSKEACETLLADLWSAIIEEESGGAVTGFTLVIDGRTLELALQAGLEDTFLRLAGCCRAVICCRSTPLQKSQVVRLVRDKLGVLTLAIGDGANDVSMIQTADVGIGISGQEGMQAVMSSDFAISRFRHLRKLLLVHGHWCYTRLAKMTLYFFYKNIAYVNLLFWYQFFCGFSGSTMSNYWILIFFNLLFTSAPPLLYGILDKDVSADTLLQLPLLYQAGQNSQAYLPSTFWCTVLDALYQSLACFLIPYFTYADSDISVFSFGTPLNTSALLIILLHLVIESQTLTWMHSTVLLGSAVFYCAFVLVFSVTCVTCNSPSNPLGVDVRHMSDPLFYCVCILTTVVALLPRILYRSICNSICPSDLLKAAQLDRQNPEERRMKIQLWRSSQASSKPLYLNMEFDATRQHDTPPGLRHLLIPEET